VSLPTRGLLLFAHGARDPGWVRPFEAVRLHCLRLRPGRPVALAYLEFIQPGLVEAGTGLAEAGCAEVDIVPLFLGTGGHVRRDVPALVDELVQRHPQVRWQLQATVGESDQLVEAMARIAVSFDDKAFDRNVP
jgi:sirohydrochlorin cobaltochelatase